MTTLFAMLWIFLTLEVLFMEKRFKELLIRRHNDGGIPVFRRQQPTQFVFIQILVSYPPQASNSM
jgi:hypothetical protein